MVGLCAHKPRLAFLNSGYAVRAVQQKGPTQNLGKSYLLASFSPVPVGKIS